MPVGVNHAIEVIFQDYHFNNKVVNVAATPGKNKNERGHWEVKAFVAAA